MNVRQLRERLKQLPDYLPVVMPSEYGPEVEILLVTAFDHPELGQVACLDY